MMIELGSSVSRLFGHLCYLVFCNTIQWINLACSTMPCYQSTSNWMVTLCTGDIDTLKLSSKSRVNRLPCFVAHRFNVPSFLVQWDRPVDSQSPPFICPPRVNHCSELFAAHPSNIPRALVSLTLELPWKRQSELTQT